MDFRVAVAECALGASCKMNQVDPVDSISTPSASVSSSLPRIPARSVSTVAVQM